MEVVQDASWQGPPVSDEKLSFVSSWECPFAQRVWIALLAKGVPFDKHEIDLRDSSGQYAPHERAEWVRRLNPNGKVPILCLRHGDSIHSAYESTVVNELLEDLAPEPALWPADNKWLKARGRMIINGFESGFLRPFYGLLLRQEAEAQQQCAQRLAGVIEWLDAQADAEGPFFLGKQFTLVDASLAPFFLRLPVLKHYRGFDLPPARATDCVKLRDWADAIRQHKHVAATCVSPKQDMDYGQYLTWVYERYAAGNAQSTSAKDYRTED